MARQQYLVIIEQAGENLSAYAPDVPGVGVAADTREEALRLMEEALALHFEAMLAAGEALPMPNSDPQFVGVELPAPAPHP